MVYVPRNYIIVFHLLVTLHCALGSLLFSIDCNVLVVMEIGGSNLCCDREACSCLAAWQVVYQAMLVGGASS